MAPRKKKNIKIITENDLDSDFKIYINKIMYGEFNLLIKYNIEKYYISKKVFKVFK